MSKEILDMEINMVETEYKNITWNQNLQQIMLNRKLLIFTPEFWLCIHKRVHTEAWDAAKFPAA
jgi:hypothetical protein